MTDIKVKDGRALEDPKVIFSNTLIELAEKNNNIVLVSADSALGGGGTEFKERFPDRFIDFGICEQNAVAAAAGMAWAGLKPFWEGIATFATMRCFEQIRNDIVRPELNVVLCARGGLTYSSQGPTHVAIDEIGILRTLPKIIIAAPADGSDLADTIRESIKIKGPIYIRKHKNLMPKVNPDNYKFEIGKGVICREGNDITLMGCGTMVYTALEVAKLLKKDKISSRVINMHTIKPIDKELVIESAKNTGIIATLEEHTIFNGLGSAVADVLSENYPVKLIKFGFNDRWPTDGVVWEEVMDYHGLSAKKIYIKIKKLFK